MLSWNLKIWDEESVRALSALSLSQDFGWQLQTSWLVRTGEERRAGRSFCGGFPAKLCWDIFMGDPPPYPGNCLKSISLMLGCCLSCTVAVFLPGWYPADGSPDPSTGSRFPVWSSGLPLHLGVAAPCCGFIVPARLGWGTCPAVELCCSRNDGWFLPCCRRIESAGIIEDDIPGSLRIQTQPLPAREQLLPKILNTHHYIHQQQDSERTGEQSLCCS